MTTTLIPPLTSVPISDARRLAKRHNARLLVVLTVGEDGRCAATSYGKTKRECRELAEWVDRRTGRICAEMAEEAPE